MHSLFVSQLMAGIVISPPMSDLRRRADLIFRKPFEFYWMAFCFFLSMGAAILIWHLRKENMLPGAVWMTYPAPDIRRAPDKAAPFNGQTTGC